MSKENNREKMPTIAGVVDQFRAIFGDGVKVTYASENGIELGKKPVDTGVILPPVYIGKPARGSTAIPTTTIRSRNTRRP